MGVEDVRVDLLSVVVAAEGAGDGGVEAGGGGWDFEGAVEVVEGVGVALEVEGYGGWDGGVSVWSQDEGALC